jgi:hypothetical protein
LVGFDEDGCLAPWMVQPCEDDNESFPNEHRNYGSGLHFQQIEFPNRLAMQQFMQKKADDVSSSSTKIKPGKLTSSIYNPSSNSKSFPILPLDRLIEINVKRLSDANYYYDPLFGEGKPFNTLQGIQQQSEDSLRGDYNQCNPASNSNIAQLNRSLPWFDGRYTALGNQLSNSADGNLHTSVSATSLSDFAMTELVWPSMNNLATAAESLATSANLIEVHEASQLPSSEDLLVEQAKSAHLGAHSKLQSLSNVALDELEALETIEELKRSKDLQSDTNFSSQMKSANLIEHQTFDVGYNIDDPPSPTRKNSRDENSLLKGELGTSGPGSSGKQLVSGTLRHYLIFCNLFF